MKHKHYSPFLILLLVAGIAGALWIRARAATVSTTNSLGATGVIETRQTGLANQIGGQITEVLVEEGQAVKANQPLIRLDESLLSAQRKVAQSSVDSAKNA